MKVYVITYYDDEYGYQYYGVGLTLEDVDKKCQELLSKNFSARDKSVKRGFFESKSLTEDGNLVTNEDELIWGYKYGKNNEYLSYDFWIIIEDV